MVRVPCAIEAGTQGRGTGGTMRKHEKTDGVRMVLPPKKDKHEKEEVHASVCVFLSVCVMRRNLFFCVCHRCTTWFYARIVDIC